MGQHNLIHPQQAEHASCPSGACDEHLHNSSWRRSKCHKGLSESWVWIHTCVTEQSGRNWSRQRWTLVSGLPRAGLPICTTSSGEASLVESSTDELQHKNFATRYYQHHNGAISRAANMSKPIENTLKNSINLNLKSKADAWHDWPWRQYCTEWSLVHFIHWGFLKFLTDKARFYLVLIQKTSC